MCFVSVGLLLFVYFKHSYRGRPGGDSVGVIYKGWSRHRQLGQLHKLGSNPRDPSGSRLEMLTDSSYLYVIGRLQKRATIGIRVFKVTERAVSTQ